MHVTASEVCFNLLKEGSGNMHVGVRVHVYYLAEPEERVSGLCVHVYVCVGCGINMCGRSTLNDCPLHPHLNSKLLTQ